MARRPSMARIACAAAAVLAGSPGLARGEEPALRYAFELELDPATGRVRGSGEIALVNSSARPLERVPLVLYPNRFRSIDPRITDVNFSRYYAYRFHPGSIAIESVVGRDGAPLDLVVPDAPAMPEGTLAEVQLAEPVPPGGTARLGIRFETVVPERFGPFGRRGERVLAEGGLWPLVPARDGGGAFVPALGPMAARHDVTLRVSGGAAVLGSSGQGREGLARTREVARTLFVGAGQDLGVIARSPARPELGAPEIVYRGPEDEGERARRVVALVSEAARSFRREWLPPGAVLEPIVVVEAPLRDRLVLAGDVLLASDRLFEVLPLLDSFQEREVTRATFELLARRAVGAREGPDCGWLGEALGWVAVEEWERARNALTGRDVRATLGWFDWISAVDGLLRAPQFASSDLYFGNLYEPRDAVRDELERFGSWRPRGRVVAEKLRDKLGSARLHELARRTLAGGDGSSARERAGRLAGEDLGAFFDLWLGPPPLENLAIDGREAVELPNGQPGIAVTVVRKTPDARLGAVGEPVQVQVESGGRRERQTWDGRGDRTTLVFPRQGFLYSVDVDPEGRIQETFRGDDGWPNWCKLLVNRFGASADLNAGNTSSAGVGVTLHPLYDYSHSVLIDGFYSHAERGGRIGYAYHFGTAISEILFGQTAWCSVEYASLSTGLVRDATVTETTGRLAAYALGYSITTRQGSVHPTHGVTLSAGLESSYSPVLGGDFTYERATGGLTWIVSPVRPITLAFRVGAGHLVGSNPPSQALFELGGEDGVRGVRTGDFVGEAFLAFKGELRASVLEDLDVNLLWLAWVRRLELAVFSDAGDVFAGLEGAFRVPAAWKVGVGAGVRIEIDALGIRPLAVRFDVGWRVDDQPGGAKSTTPQLYFGVNQPF